MNRLTILLFALMFFSVSTSAQKKQVTSIQWKITGELPASQGQLKALGFAGVIAGMHHGVLIVGGGSNFPDSMPWLGGIKKYYDDAYVFKKNSDGSLKNYKSFRLPFSIAYTANCSTPQGIVCAGGENENGISNKVLLIQWNAAKENIIVKGLPELPFAVTNASITSIDNTVYVAGGEMKRDVSNYFLCLDLDNIAEGWQQLASLLKPVSHAVMVVQSNGHHNCIYLIGGRKKNSGSTSVLYSSNLQFDLKINKWTDKKSLPYNLSAGTGIASGSKYIFLFGGDKGETFHKTEELIISINNEKDPEKKQKLNQQKIHLQSSHPGFTKHVLVYNTISDVWSTAGNIPFEAPVTTTAINWNGNIFIPGGEIKAGVRSPQIILGKFSYK